VLTRHLLPRWLMPDGRLAGLLRACAQ
jgi:hypothetical protein